MGDVEQTSELNNFNTSRTLKKIEDICMSRKISGTCLNCGIMVFLLAAGDFFKLFTVSPMSFDRADQGVSDTTM